jgi:hypothetical protein
MASTEEKQKIHRMLSEYLSDESYTRTCEVFTEELTNRGELGDVQLHSSNGVDGDELMEAFELGEREAFFEIWDKMLPEEAQSKDPVTLNLEFNISLYFAVYGYCSGQEHKVETEKKAFKEYLETRGSAVAQSEEFVAFYALPYIPDPRQHPSFKCLFTDKWTNELSQRIRGFMEAYCPKGSHCPSLLTLLRGEEFPPKGGQNLQRELAEVTAKYQKVSKQLKEITQSYHTLVGVSTEMVSALEIAVKEKMIEPEFLTRTCSKLFQAPATRSLDLTRPGTAASVLRASINAATFKPLPEDKEVPYLPSLDFSQLKHDLQTIPNKEKATLIQALRWRLTQSQSGEQRDQVLVSYVQHDLLGLAEQGTSNVSIGSLISCQDPDLQEQMSRMINTLSSLQRGRVYLAHSHNMIAQLVAVVKKMNFIDNPIQRNIVGALQKLSLRRQSQSEMISHDLVSWTVMLLADHSDDLSDYTFHYSLALLMNLSLRTKGRQCCVPHRQVLLRLLSDLLEHDSEEVRSYVHGILYSVLGVSEVKSEARAMGMEAMLKSAVSSSPPEMKSQLNYIIKQLLSNSSGNIIEGVAGDSDGEDDEEDVSSTSVTMVTNHACDSCILGGRP